MRIVGQDLVVRDEHDVHTIDVWFSERRRCWIVERLDIDGHQIGLAVRCETEADAADCLACWLRAHPEACLVAPLGRRASRVSAVRVLKEARHRAA